MPVQGCLKTQNKSQENSEKYAKNMNFHLANPLIFRIFAL